MTAVLVLPGYENSGPEHWQTIWEQENPSFKRLTQSDWYQPKVADWVDALQKAVAAQSEPVVLVAHSLGCIAIAHWAARYSVPIQGALLVAPADIDLADVAALANFQPIPLRPLPFPSIVVASSDDPWAAMDRSRLFAESWGSRFVDLGAHGHINSESGLGSWAQGKSLLAQLIP